MSGAGTIGQGTRVPSATLPGLTFVAGFLAAPLPYQPMPALLHALGVPPTTPCAMRPLPPFGVPQVLSQSSRGGAGHRLRPGGAALSSRRGVPAAATLFGAVAPNLVAWFVVVPTKGLPVDGA